MSEGRMLSWCCCVCVGGINVIVSRYVCEHMHMCVHVDRYEEVWVSVQYECSRGLTPLCIYPLLVLFNPLWGMNETWIIIFSFNLSLSHYLSLFSLPLNVEPPWEGGGAILGTTPTPQWFSMILNIFMPISLTIILSITMCIFLYRLQSFLSFQGERLRLQEIPFLGFWQVMQNCVVTHWYSHSFSSSFCISWITR